MEMEVYDLEQNQCRQLKLERQLKEFHLFRKHIVDKSIDETEKLQINIFELSTSILKKYGFSLIDEGTYYLSDIIEQVYHERKIFDDKIAYFNLNDDNNEHYIKTCETYDCDLKEMHLEINFVHYNSKLKDISINTIVYGIVKIISEQYDNDKKKSLVKVNL